MNTEAGEWKEVQQNLGSSSPLGELHDREAASVGEFRIGVGEKFPAWLGEQGG